MLGETLKEWSLYEAGKKFNGRLEPNYNETVNTNLDFYTGNQWKNVKSNGVPTPVFNILKRGVQFFVSSLMSNKVKINFEQLEDQDDGDPLLNISQIATQEVGNLFEKFKMDNRIRDALIDAAVIGDVAAHMYFDTNIKPYGQIEGNLGLYEGEIQFDLVDGTNIYFGNANNPLIDTRTQPYIIISGRDLVENLKEEALENGEGITNDTDTFDMAGSQSNIEIDGDGTGKAKFIIYYRYDKKTGTIHASKLTENVYIYKDKDTGLTRYPIAWLCWEKQKNVYHGRAVCTGMIPNQILINKMFAMVIYSIMQTAFPKAVYDADRVTSWTNEIGQAIPVTGLMPGDSIKHIAGYLETGEMSNQVIKVLELAIQYTKECLGINEAMMGDINPEVASGKSIVATVSQSVVPLENPKANLYEWIEDIGKILLDMMANYYGQRPLIVNTETGRSLEMFDFNKLRKAYLFTKIDVGASSWWSEIAGAETLDSLLQQGLLDIVEYLESMPEGFIPNRQGLIASKKAFAAAQSQIQQQMPMEEVPQEQPLI